MGRITKTISLSVPPEMAKKIKRLMKEEGRTRSELIREALRRYMEEQEWEKIYRYGEMKVREKRITEDQIESIIDAHRE
ncbi:MAG: ribbon-helix-helix domain-containing protein [Actinobacteria bacterium]|nr:ribbon-helix-helix domain-containing protein [Cyanobacteriota bacterium]MCL5771661.1 ribbon-helix-helix domain-containing protein [Actinomycetota bacterium]